MNGLIVLDKPQGFTSFDAVAKMRGITGIKRIGHGGTLDPMATGVLPIFIGPAARAIDLDPDNRKSYIAEIKTGIATDTGDITGTVTREAEPLLDPDDLLRVIPHFLGETLQTPPMYSAVSIGGKRLYELAREGKTVERPARPIFIDSIGFMGFDPESHTLKIEVNCRKGTYIRVLAEDMLRAAGSLGTLTSLRRTRSGSFTLEDAMTFPEIEALGRERLPEVIRDVESVFVTLPEFTLNADNARRFLNGVPVKYLRNVPGGVIRIKAEGSFLGLGEMREGTLIKVKQFI